MEAQLEIKNNRVGMKGSTYVPVERDVNAKYYERGNHANGEKALLRWILGFVSTLLVAAVLGAWNAAERLAKLEATTDAIQRQLDRLEARIPPRYRGEPDGGLSGGD